MSEEKDEELVTPSTVALELLSKAKNAKCWLVMWMDEERAMHWRGERAYTLLGMMEVLKQELVESLAGGQEEEDE